MKGRIGWVMVALLVTTASCASRPSEQASAPKAIPESGSAAANDIPDPADRCPDAPEDRANFEDDDGCPDPDPVRAISEVTFPPTACLLETERWDGTEPVTELHLLAGGPVYALATQPRARLHVAVGPIGLGSAVEFEDSGFVLRGFLKSDAFTLHPNKPLVMGGFVIPAPFAVFRWTAAREGEVSAGYDIGPGVEVTEPLAANLPCADVTIDFASFEAEAVLGDVSKATDAQLQLGHPIELRTKPGGKFVARLSPKDDDDSLVKVLGSARGSKRIFWWRDTALVFGWVAASELRARTVGLTGYGTGHGGPVLPKSEKVFEVLRCDREIALFAEAGGQRSKVGSIKSGTAFDVLGHARDFDTVQAHSKRIAAAKGAKLLASKQELVSCVPVKGDGAPK